MNDGIGSSGMWNLLSCPARGRWIERSLTSGRPAMLVSCPARGRWIEREMAKGLEAILKSCPARGRWIEREVKRVDLTVNLVLPRTGQVD